MYKVFIIKLHYSFAQLWAQLVVRQFFLTWWWVAIRNNTKSNGNWESLLFWKFYKIWLQIRRKQDSQMGLKGC